MHIEQFVLIILTIVAAIMSYVLYHQNGESIALFIIVAVGLINPSIGWIGSSTIILYFLTRSMLA